MGSLFRRRKKRSDGTIIELPTLWLKYYQHGRAIRESSGTTKETIARRMLRAREGDVEHGIPVNPKMGRVTFEDAAKDIINDYTINKRKSLANLQRRLKLHLEPHFAGKRLASITPSDVRAFVVARTQAKASNGEINRELAVLKRMFTLAVHAGELYSKPHIPMLHEDNVRQGFFERADFERVRDLLPEALRPVVTFAYLTGWRRSEILTLEWRQVDFEGHTVRLDPGTTKSGAGRTYPFTTELKALLEAQRALHDALKATDRIVPYVFHRDGEPIRSFRGAWTSACTAAGVSRIVHDFRRTAVRNLERAGVPRSVAMAMVGHKTEAIYRRYAIVDAASLREAAGKINAMGTLSGTPSTRGTVRRMKRSAK
jgi:integrase